MSNEQKLKIHRTLKDLEADGYSPLEESDGDFMLKQYPNITGNYKSIKRVFKRREDGSNCLNVLGVSP